MMGNRMKCEHSLVKYIGMQELLDGKILFLGDCLGCKSTITIDENYLLVVEKDFDLYERIK